MDIQATVEDTFDDLTTHTGTPSASPLVGMPIPIRRTIPMDVHSLLDYGNGVQALTLGAMAASPFAKSVNAFLGVQNIAVSLLTDYRLSLAKKIPIEVHEIGDHVFGMSMIATPFLFGYWKKEPVVTAMQVFMGVATIAASLFTDYRASRGVKWGLPIVRRGNR